MEAIRQEFEAKYSSGDVISDAMSLARRDDGEYEQSLARLCFKWFCRGRVCSHSDLTMLDSPEMVEAIMRGIYSSRGEKFTYDQAKEWAAKDGYIVAKCAIDLLEIEAKAALAEIKKAMGGDDEGDK